MQIKCLLLNGILWNQNFFLNDNEYNVKKDSEKKDKRFELMKTTLLLVDIKYIIGNL